MRTVLLLTVACAAIVNAQVVHQGQCPAITARNRGPCVQMCQEDGQCANGFKCCDTGCGKLCRAALFDSATIRLQPQQNFINNQQQRPNQQAGANAIRNFAQNQLAAQPSLVGLSQCSRGATLRNPDGSTLVCGFGPRDFGCPVGFSCVIDNSLRALICCPEDDSTPSPKDEKFENPCIDGQPLTDEANKRIQCNPLGGSNSGCPAGTSCNSGSCCPLSVAGFLTVKSGVCPMPHPVSNGGSCPNECSFDSDCIGALKCCFTGCGARCVNVQPSSPGAPATGFGPPGSVNFQAQLDPRQGAGPRTNGNSPFLNNNNNNNNQFRGNQRQFGGPQRNPIGPPGFSPQQRPNGQNGPQQRARQPQPPQFSPPLPALKDFPAKSESIEPSAAVKNVRPGVSLVSVNDSCDSMRCSACHQCMEVESVPHCVRQFDCCPDGSSPTACNLNPCPSAKCPDNLEAFCIPDGCGTCKAAYYDRFGNVAPCPTFRL